MCRRRGRLTKLLSKQDVNKNINNNEKGGRLPVAIVTDFDDKQRR